MKRWLRAHGWLMLSQTVTAGTEFTLRSNYTGPRNQLQQITIAVSGRAIEQPNILWQQGTVSTDLPPVSQGQWQVCVEQTGQWLCLDQRYNKLKPMPEVSTHVLKEGTVVQGPGLFYLVTGQLDSAEGSFSLAEDQTARAETDSVILQFSRARDE